ncbi:MAG TPA: hypothetical protein PKA53_09715 [Sphingobacterium sp.]|nr:hypothetical protein [Sphingobacterium sp.]
MENKDLDSLFREAFKDAEEAPHDRVWQSIEAALGDQADIVPLRHKRSFHWLYYAAAASVIVALGLVIWTTGTVVDRTGGTTETAFQQPADNLKDQAVADLPIIPKTEDQGNAERPNSRTQPVLVATTHAGKSTSEHHLAVVKTMETLQTDAIEPVGPKQLTSGITIEYSSALPTYKITEVGDIKPLIEPDEEMESMYATATPDLAGNRTIVTSLLNTLSENIEIANAKDIRFRTDEEGSLRVDILNSLVKNRNKKRK